MNSPVGKFVVFAILLTLYYQWVRFEQEVVSPKLYPLSLEHIKMFRQHAKKYKIFDLCFTLVSQLGDKFGMFGYTVIAF